MSVNTQRTNKKMRILKILTVIITLLASFGFMALIAMLRNAGHGYDSSDKVISEFIDAMASKKESDAAKCLYGYSKNYHTVSDSITDYVDNTEDVLQPDSDKNYTEEVPLGNFLEEHTEASDAKKIIKHIYAETNSTKKFNVFQIITYKIDDKWYIYDFDNKLDVILETSPLKSGTEAGNETTGYFFTSDWYATSYSKDDGSSELSIAKDTAQITISAINIDLPIDEMIEKTKQTLDDKYFIISTDDSVISGMTCKRLVAYNAETGNYKYFWMYRQPVLDSYTHMIELSAKDPTEGYSIISSYHTRKKV